MTFWPGTRVRVFDSRLYINDKKTPLSFTMKPATVVKWYGYRSSYNTNWIYSDCVDVRFDHRKEVSKEHFTNGCIII